MKDHSSIPHKQDLEKAVLGALLVDSTAHLEALPILKLPEMFFAAEHQHIFTAIQELSFANKPIDLITVSQQLIQSGTLDKAGGMYALSQLASGVGSAAHIEYHSRILQQYWLRRKLIQKAETIKAQAYNEELDSMQVLENDAKLNDELNELLFSGTGKTTYADALEQVEKRVELLSSQKEGEFTGVTTGFPKLNKFTGGWQPSDLVIVAARPAMGKTAFILKNLVDCGLRGIPAGMFSLEMSVQQLAARTVSINSNFHLTQLIRDGFEKNEYFVTLKNVVTPMKDFKFLIDDTANQDIREIISKARIWKRKHGIQILFIDYIQLATDKTKGNNREQEIASISRGLKMLAKELNIPVIALSQLSRQVEQRPNKRPKLSDLRESGAIEQDADIVSFLYRPEYYDEDVPEEILAKGGNSEYSIAKYRAGSLATLPLWFQGDKAKYSDPVERSQEQEAEEAWYSPDLPKMDPANDNPF